MGSPTVTVYLIIEGSSYVPFEIAVSSKTRDHASKAAMKKNKKEQTNERKKVQWECNRFGSSIIIINTGERKPI